MQGRIFAYRKLEYSKQIEEKLQIEILCTKIWLEKSNFILKEYFHVQSTKGQNHKYLQEEVKNDETCN